MPVLSLSCDRRDNPIVQRKPAGDRRAQNGEVGALYRPAKKAERHFPVARNRTVEASNVYNARKKKGVRLHGCSIKDLFGCCGRTTSAEELTIGNHVYTVRRNFKDSELSTPADHYKSYQRRIVAQDKSMGLTATVNKKLASLHSFQPLTANEYPLSGSLRRRQKKEHPQNRG